MEAAEGATDAVSDLMQKWGYEDIWPENVVDWPEIPSAVHTAIGLLLILQGLPGTALNVVALVTNLQCRSALIDPSGLILTNFFVANLCLSILQYPFSGVSAIAGRWLFGDIGCQVYGTIGFVFGIGSVLSLGLIALDLYFSTCSKWLQDKTTIAKGRFSFLFIFLQWQYVFLVSTPPILGVMGRFYYEPSKTACTIDYWHKGFKNYPTYILILTTFGYILPTVAMTLMVFKSSKAIDHSARGSTNLSLQHYQGMLKFSKRCLAVMGLCWSPYAILCLYSAAFDPSTINIYVTLIPTFAAKTAPVLNGYLALRYIPRLRKGLQYLRGQMTEIPQELVIPLKHLNSN